MCGGGGTEIPFGWVYYLAWHKGSIRSYTSFNFKGVARQFPKARVSFSMDDLLKVSYIYFASPLSRYFHFIGSSDNYMAKPFPPKNKKIVQTGLIGELFFGVTLPTHGLYPDPASAVSVTIASRGKVHGFTPYSPCFFPVKKQSNSPHKLVFLGGDGGRVVWEEGEEGFGVF